MIVGWNKWSPEIPRSKNALLSSNAGNGMMTCWKHGKFFKRISAHGQMIYQYLQTRIQKIQRMTIPFLHLFNQASGKSGMIGLWPEV